MFKKNKTLFLGFLLIFILSCFAWYYLTLPGFFSMHDDMQFIRVYEIDKCLKDGQFPCRWVPDLGYGYGYPLFNYYSPFPYYLGEIFHLLGFSILDSVKIVFGIGLILSGIFMFLFAKEFWGDLGGLISAILYIYAPYHSVDIYVRGALAESWSLVWFPLISLFIYKILREEKFKWVIFLALSYGLLLLSHNIMSMLFTIFTIFWIFFLFLQKPSLKKLVFSGIGIIWGLLLSSFFVLPALLEKKYVHTETMFMGYFNYLAHFVDLRQLFINSKWGWGASVWGPDDGMPFMIGYFHWVIALLVLIFSWVSLRKKKKEAFLIVLFFFTSFVLSVFMTHSRSNFFWKIFKFLQYLQFPWRFLALVIFFSSFLGGGIILLLPKAFPKKIFTTILVLGIIFAYFGYFRPETLYLNQKDEDRLQGEKWSESQKNAIFDYLPIYAQYPPDQPAPDFPQVISGKAEVKNFQKGTNWQHFEVQVVEDAEIQLSLYYFPGWEVLVDEQKVNIRYDNFLGLITIRLPPGEHQVKAILRDTLIRKIANNLSLNSFLALMITPLVYLFKKRALI